MDELEVVKEIVEKNFKSGETNGKKWALHKYRTNTDKVFTSFDELEEGDTVKLTYNDEYKNWQGGKLRKADTQHDEVMKALRQIYSEVKKLTGGNDD